MGNKIKENQYKPQRITHPGYTLGEKIKEMGISAREFSMMAGISEDCLNKVISGNAELTGDIANKIEKLTHIPTRFWLLRQKNYNEHHITQEQTRISSDGWKNKFSITELLKIKISKPISDFGQL